MSDMRMYKLFLAARTLAEDALVAHHKQADEYADGWYMEQVRKAVQDVELEWSVLKNETLK